MAYTNTGDTQGNEAPAVLQHAQAHCPQIISCSWAQKGTAAAAGEDACVPHNGYLPRTSKGWIALLTLLSYQVSNIRRFKSQEWF